MGAIGVIVQLVRCVTVHDIGYPVSIAWLLQILANGAWLQVNLL